MSLNKLCQLCATHLFKQISTIKHINNRVSITSLASKKLHKEDGRLVISCRRKKYDFYTGQKFSKFDEVVLASKGWTHHKSKGDYFVVHPNPDAHEEGPRKPLKEVDIAPNLINCLSTQNITDLTSFQNQALAVIRNRKHAILTAETGCGKTLAYLLPILQNLIEGNSTEEMNTPRALILIPNRELAYQIGAVAQPLAESNGLKLKVMVGGRTKKMMLNPEFANIDILIGTPGAIGKLSNVGVFRLHNVAFTVLDEADTLIDDSFIDRINGIIKRVAQSQLILVSATLPKKMPPILEPYEQNFVHVTSPMLHKPLCNITQRFLRVIRTAKPVQILDIAKKEKQPLLIFTNRNDTCNWLAMFLSDNGLKCVRINGDMNYAVRIEQWNHFITGQTNILIATDVGSRGLDTTQIKHVVNYDFPLYAADYLHRIGRTGRFGSPDSCKVTNFIAGSNEVMLLQKIELAIRKNEPIPNVDGNITRIVKNKILRSMREDDNML